MKWKLATNWIAFLLKENWVKCMSACEMSMQQNAKWIHRPVSAARKHPMPAWSSFFPALAIIVLAPRRQVWACKERSSLSTCYVDTFFLHNPRDVWWGKPSSGNPGINYSFPQASIQVTTGNKLCYLIEYFYPSIWANLFNHY